MKHKIKSRGFTLIELLVTITIVAILTGISTISIKGYITDAKENKAKAEFKGLEKAVLIAQTLSEKLLMDITGKNGTMDECGVVIEGGGDLTDPSLHQACLNDWKAALASIGSFSGTDVSDFELDPWGAPYLLDEGGEGDCHYSILASAGKNGDFSDQTLRIEIYSPTETTCNAEEEESVGDPEASNNATELSDLFPNFPMPKFPLLMDCYFNSAICKPPVVKCIPKKNRNGCAVKTVNFYKKIGEISE